MKSLENSNPYIQLLYFISIIVLLSLFSDFIMLFVAFVCAIIYVLTQTKTKPYIHIAVMVSAAAITIINPLISHNGVTVMFMLYDKPITLEALLYGAYSAITVVTVIYFCVFFGSIFTRDRLIYIFGKFSPKAALIISLSFRFIPLFGKKAEEINDSQKAIGLYKEGNIISTVKGKTSVFSSLVSWGLENGIITSGSMRSRGYDSGKRSFCGDYRFEKSDGIWLGFIILLTSGCSVLFGSGYCKTVFYPEITPILFDAFGNVTRLCFAFLCMLPIIIEIKECLKWKYLISKI